MYHLQVQFQICTDGIRKVVPLVNIEYVFVVLFSHLQSNDFTELLGDQACDECTYEEYNGPF